VGADRHLCPEILASDMVDAALAEDAITHAFALLVAGLDAVDLLRSGPFGRASLLAFAPALLLRLALLALLAFHRLLLITLLALGALLLLALLTLRALRLLALTPLDLLLLIALTALHLLLLDALATLGLHGVALALTLDLLRPLALRTLDGASLDAGLTALDPGLAPFHARRCTLGSCTGGLANGVSSSTTAPAAASAPITLLCLGQAGSAGAEQQYPGCRRNQLPVHVDKLPVTPSADAALRCVPRVLKGATRVLTACSDPRRATSAEREAADPSSATLRSQSRAPVACGTSCATIAFYQACSTACETRSPPMNEMFAQGDLLIERVDDIQPSGTIVAADQTGATVLAEGELTGHRHAIFDRVTMFREDSLARDIPSGLYVGHVKVEGSAVIQHQEHSPIMLAEGTYRVRRQRELEPKDATLVSD
jgi:hypothetical protein